jgi:hypothetical protein
LFASGVDLDVKTRVAMDMKWKPVSELAEEIHEGDPSIRDTWPLTYWSKEPFQSNRDDAAIRYASAFQRTGIPNQARVDHRGRTQRRSAYAQRYGQLGIDASIS